MTPNAPTTRLAAGAVAGAGAAIAATKVALDRRSASDHAGPSRRYRLRRKEPPAAGVRRIAEGRLDDALEHLGGEAGASPEDAIHETRKDLKKVRSTLRLVRDELGADVYRRENDRYRDAGRLLAGSRDAQVKLDTLHSLEDRLEGHVPEEVVREYRAALERDRDTHASANGNGAIARAVAEIEAGRTAIAEWPLKADDWALVEAGLARSYSRGRARFADVREEAGDEAVHEWRKRVKDLWYQLRIVRNTWKPVLRETADEAHRLSDLLGDHHDLAVLGADARSRAEVFADGSLDGLLEVISERQDELAAEAIAAGELLYAEKPKAFVSRIGAYWRAWR